MQEEWKDIKDYEGLYQISNKGNVKSLGRWIDRKCKGKKWKEEKILKPKIVKNGYQRVGLWKNGKLKFFIVHRLVAMAFLPNPNNLPQVNHKDENKQNNCVENLEWCDQKYNNNYGTRTKKTSKPVVQIDQLTDTIIAEYPSLSEVQRQLGYKQGNISQCCKGNRKTCGGFKWRYK